jgi:hypothetical protein
VTAGRFPCTPGRDIGLTIPGTLSAIGDEVIPNRTDILKTVASAVLILTAA